MHKHRVFLKRKLTGLFCFETAVRNNFILYHLLFYLHLRRKDRSNFASLLAPVMLCWVITAKNWIQTSKAAPSKNRHSN